VNRSADRGLVITGMPTVKPRGKQGPVNQGDCGRDRGEGTDLLVEISRRPRAKDGAERRTGVDGSVRNDFVAVSRRSPAHEESPRIRVKPKSVGEAAREVRWARRSVELRVTPQDPWPAVHGAAAAQLSGAGEARRGPARVGHAGVLEAGSSREDDRRILRDRPDASRRRSNREDKGSLRW
jgi:hypothetical protein